jgi:predicted XRE-type DNA-binding protein
MSAEASRTLLGRYRLVYRLGQGAMGSVWLADDMLLERAVALKQLVHFPGAVEGHPEMVARLMAEARAAARLRHPGLVTIHDVVLDGGEPWIVMEYVSGRSLSDEIARNRRLPWQQVADIGAQVAEAVAAAHRGGIVHRDLKPANILLTEEGRAVVVDFGIAKASSAATMTSRGTVVGTPEFLAPELLNGQGASPATDMWALGVTLYQAVQGRPPFSEPTLTALLAAILARSPAPAEHAGPLDGLLQALLSKDPIQRPDAPAVQRALSSYRPVRSDGEAATSTMDVQGAIAPPVPPVPPRGPGAGASAEYPDEPLDGGFFEGATDTVPSTVPEFIAGTVIVDPDNITTRAELVQALQAVKRQADLTAKEVATVIGVPVSTVRGYFDRNRLPAERERILQILLACGIPSVDLPRWEGALVRVRSQRLQAASTRRRRSQDASREDSRHFGFGPSGDPVGDSTDDRAGDADLLFRVYIPKTQLYAEQRREMLRLFRVWLTTVQGHDVRQQDFSTKDGDTVAFYVGLGQLRPALGEEYREFVSFVEYSAHSPATAIDRLTEIGIDESTGTELVTDYAIKYHRIELGLRHARQNRILSLQQTLEGQLLDKGANPQGIAAIQSVQIRSLLDQVVPPPTAAASLPAIAAPDLRQPPTQMNMTFNAEQIIYTAIDSIQGTANFGPEPRRLLALINQHAGTQAGPLLTAFHEVEDPGIPVKERFAAKKKLTSFLVDLAKRLPDVGVDLLEAYLKRKLGLPDS